MQKNDSLLIPATIMPSFRSALALQNGTEKNLLFKVIGGIGDRICAEPTIRYALTHFKDCKISVISHSPEFFEHLYVKDNFHFDKDKINYDDYLVFETLTQPDESSLTWQFFSHMLTQCVEYSAICALRSQLPIKDREVILQDIGTKFNFRHSDAVVIHAGAHWQSKTFPKDWWDEVIHQIQKMGIFPVLIGANEDENRKTVGIDSGGCIDLRNKLSLMETVSLLKKSKVLLTNDSAPLHMAADSDCWIGMIATVKHPDFITHWRRGQWGYRMQNFSKGGMWELHDICPNKSERIDVDKVDEKILRTWLPEPKELADWAFSKIYY